MRLIDDQKEVFAHLPQPSIFWKTQVTWFLAPTKAVSKGRLYSMLGSICF